MTTDLVLMVIGGLLLGTGILGGGFELKELKVPKVGKVTRFVSTTAGAVLILLGLGMAVGPVVPTPDPSPVSSGSPLPPDSPEPPEREAEFTIVDNLGIDQVSEAVTVMFDGRYAGTLKVDMDFPDDELTLIAPEAGTYSYHIEAEGNFYDAEADEIFNATGVGQGSIYVSDGSVFRLAGSFSGTTWAITLVEDDSV
jgi:hypothetical protein